MGGTASGAANDFAIGIGLKEDPYNPTPRDDMSGRISPYEARTRNTRRARKAFEKDQAKYRNQNDPEPRKPTMDQAEAPSDGDGGEASAPALPDPDAVGETEQALLDANKKGRSSTLDANRKGRSSTIATSAKGLLSGEESTRKKRSLMGGMIR